MAGYTTPMGQGLVEINLYQAIQFLLIRQCVQGFLWRMQVLEDLGQLL